MSRACWRMCFFHEWLKHHQLVTNNYFAKLKPQPPDPNHKHMNLLFFSGPNPRLPNSTLKTQPIPQRHPDIYVSYGKNSQVPAKLLTQVNVPPGFGTFCAEMMGYGWSLWFGQFFACQLDSLFSLAMIPFNPKVLLGGGFKVFYVHPYLGKMIPIVSGCRRRESRWAFVNPTEMEACRWLATYWVPSNDQTQLPEKCFRPFMHSSLCWSLTHFNPWFWTSPRQG